MDLIPTPAQVVAALGNVAGRVVRGGYADVRPTPRSLVAAGDGWRVHRYDGPSPDGEPVLLVGPPAVPDGVYDLRRGCSLAEHLAGERPTYLLEHDAVEVRDHDVTLVPWRDEAVPRAVVAVAADTDRAVHLVGWGLGGVVGLLALAARPDLPVASLATLAAPYDVASVPLLAPARPLATGTPVPLVDRVLAVAPVQRWLGRPATVAAHLDDAGYLAQLEAVAILQSRLGAYRGRSFGQLYHRFVPQDPGPLEPITAPVLVLAGADDRIAPLAAVRAVLPHLSGSREARFEVVPGGHLGMLTGRRAPGATWAVLDDWFAQWPGPTKRPATPRKATRKATRKAASKDAIGANPDRRYGSGGSRALSR